MGQGNPNKKPNRYDFAKATWGEKLLAWSKQDEIGRRFGENVDSVFATIAAYDPTQNAASRYKFLSWLCKVIVKGKIKPEDVYKIKENLETLMRIRNRLPLDKRDINHIKTARELDDIVFPYQQGEIISLSQMRYEERQQILAETEFLYEGPEGKILIPRSQRASQFWGQGTKWCISSRKETYHFDDYNKDGPIIIYITNETGIRTFNRDGKKVEQTYQIKFAGHKIDSHLRNVRDREVKRQLPVSLQQMILRSGYAKFCVENGQIKPKHFPPGTFSEDFIIDIIQQGLIEPDEDFRDVLYKADRTPKVYLALVQYSSYLIQYIPENKRSMEICELAMKLEVRSLAHVPVRRRTEDMYRDFLGHFPHHFSGFQKEIEGKSYFKELKRHAFDALIKSKKLTNEDKKKYAAHFQDVMTEAEQRNILGIRKPIRNRQQVLIP